MWNRVFPLHDARMNPMSTDEPEEPIEPSPPVSAQAPQADVYESPFAHEAGVPRRFGMGTLLLITAMYAVLFAVLRAFGLPPSAFLFVALFFTAVGLGQMLLFKGERPRRASVVVGAGFYAVATLVLFGYERVVHHRGTYPDLCFGLFWFPISGGIAGYCGGLLIAAVFLLIDKWKSHLADLRLRENKD